MNRLIINADDFGLSKPVNEAIMQSMDAGICLDTTLLVNFDESEAAAKLAIANKRIENIGIHLNLTEGLPLTKKIRNESRFCNSDGLFHNKKVATIVRLSASEKEAVRDEITAQIKLCRKFGIPISHADSHNHIHEQPGLLFLLLDIFKTEKVKCVRLANNLEKNTFAKKMYRSSYNAVLGLNKLSATDYFGGVSHLIDYQGIIKENSVVELMIHPGKIINNEIHDVYANQNLSAILPEVIKNYKLISYSQLRK